MEDSGLYITIAQMQFFLNREGGEKKFQSNHPDFKNYHKNCCLYNLVYDMMEQDPDCAKMCWDSDNGSISLSFPVNGHVAEALSEISYIDFGDEDDTDDEDIFGIFS